MAWIKPFKYWAVMSSPDNYAYQLEDGGKVYILRPTHFHLNRPPSAHKTEETTLGGIKKLKGFHFYGKYDPKKCNLPYVDVAVPLAWCIAKKRGLDILRDTYDQRMAAAYDCKPTKKKKKSRLSRS